MTVTISPLDVERETRPRFLSFLVFLRIITNKISSTTESISQPRADIGNELDVQDTATSEANNTGSGKDLASSSQFPKQMTDVARSKGGKCMGMNKRRRSVLRKLT